MIFRDTLDLLTFRIPEDRLGVLGARHLQWGLLWTWLAGMGRYWDHPGATLPQKLGLGSLVYVFLLSGLLWAVAKPLLRGRVSYRHLLTFVTLTAPPALLYAIPVERWWPLDAAGQMNAWFLALVASWRLALWAFYLRRQGGCGVMATGVMTLLPMTAVVAGLALLNLEHAVFDIMGGFRETTGHDTAYQILLFLTGLSALLVLPLLIAYAVLVWRRRQPAASTSVDPS